jgi:putative phosphoribosyl transferase
VQSGTAQNGIAMATICWSDRWAAGVALAQQLGHWHHRHGAATVIGLPRGGVVVAAAVARDLNLPLASWAVRKLALPAAPEYAVGALAAGPVVVWNRSSGVLERLSQVQRDALVAAALPDLERRQQRFGDPTAAELQGRQLLVVDDGIATGMTVEAALTSLRRVQPARLVLAVPVVDQRLIPHLSAQVDELITLVAAQDLRAVGAFYNNFAQVDDAAVEELLARGRLRRQPS